MYECPNCGGNLRYDIPSKMMACASCDSKFDPYEVSDKNGAQEQEEYEVWRRNLQYGQYCSRFLYLLWFVSGAGEPPAEGTQTKVYHSVWSDEGTVQESLYENDGKGSICSEGVEK